MHRRRYHDACGTAHALELIGDRWALLVLRELMIGGRRFSDLKGALPGISANVLTQRLGELEETGLLRKVRLQPPASVQVYEATEWGLEAEPVLQTLGRWAARSPRHDPALPLSGVSLMMSFRTMINARKAKGLNARIGFRFGDDQYVARLKKGQIKIERASAERGLDDCDTAFTGTPEGLAAVVYGGEPLASIEVAGDRALAKRFVTLFPLPPKVGADGH